MMNYRSWERPQLTGRCWLFAIEWVRNGSRESDQSTVSLLVEVEDFGDGLVNLSHEC
jgi:hypothetical protein